MTLQRQDDETGSGWMLKAVLWDMDGTLIDSEPYWHQAEINIARGHGGEWSEDIGWSCSGKPVPQVAQKMVDKGTKLSVAEIGRLMIEGVARMEAESMPWIPGVEDVLRSLVAAGIPSVLVTASPRHMAENLVQQAPEGTFVGYVCGDDDLPKKPDPAPYLAAAKIVGVDGPSEMANCVAVEDSMTGIQSAAASGATTIAQTGFIKTDTSIGPQFASISSYDGLNAEALERYVERRISLLRSR